MIDLNKRNKFPRRLIRWLLFVLLYIAVSFVIRISVPAHPAVAIESQAHAVADVQFFHDSSWLDGNVRYLSQNLFDEIINGIQSANQLIVLDMFLFNQWQGPIPENHRLLSSELSNALIKQQRRYPEMDIIVISDPINTVYGGLNSVHFDELTSAGIHLSLTKLDQLQDSNPLWSGIWRWLIRPWGNNTGDMLPNPFGEGRVSVRSYLALLNFKANHRKLMVADNQGADLHGWVSSANPHDGSSAHRNIGIRFSGQAVLDILNSERELLLMNDAENVVALLDTRLEALRTSDTSAAISSDSNTSDAETIQIVSESNIHEAVLSSIDNADAGSRIELAMFYLSERKIITALKKAASKGAQIKVLLDVNSDAFGRSKNGVPNRPVAAELVAAGIDVRWCLTKGEQCHAKWLHVGGSNKHVFYVGSANFTRRNLLDFNLETNVRLELLSDNSATVQMLKFFNDQWINSDGRQYSSSYDEFADDSGWLKAQYRFMEMTGLSTF